MAARKSSTITSWKCFVKRACFHLHPKRPGGGHIVRRENISCLPRTRQKVRSPLISALLSAA